MKLVDTTDLKFVPFKGIGSSPIASKIVKEKKMKVIKLIKNLCLEIKNLFLKLTFKSVLKYSVILILCCSFIMFFLKLTFEQKVFSVIIFTLCLFFSRFF